MKTISGMLLAIVLLVPSFCFAQGGGGGGPIVAQERGLKDTLILASENAIKKLGVVNGFFGNDKVKIPLPPALQKVEKVIRALGMKKDADELVETMNHAAEQAVPEAKTLLNQAIQKMSVQDAKGIITGGDNAATAYFRKATEAELTAKFLPIVTKATEKVGLAQKYNKIAKSGSKLGLVDKQDAKVEDYVTRKALDGLFYMMAEEEKNIRKNPMQAGSTWIRRIFGGIRPDRI